MGGKVRELSGKLDEMGGRWNEVGGKVEKLPLGRLAYETVRWQVA